MTPDTLVGLAKVFMGQSLDELKRKAPDYAPDGLCFVDLIRQCAEANIDRPEKLLWAMMSKHTTAVRAYCVRGYLNSETLWSRSQDAINFICIINAWALQYPLIMRSVRKHFEDQPCECRHEIISTHQSTVAACDRCLVLDWFARYHESSRMAST